MNDAFKRFYDGSKEAFSEIFSSERALNNLLRPKTFLGSFDYAAILNNIPFSNVQFVLVCPLCVTSENISTIKTLVNLGAIVPVLSAPYESYQEEFASFIDTRDHINRYEFYAFRHIMVLSQHNGGLCGHCAGRHKKLMERAIRSNQELGFGEDHIEEIYTSLHPFVNPDFRLMDDFRKSVRSGETETVSQIINLADVLYRMRTHEALNAPFVLTSADAAMLPSGISADVDALIADADILDEAVDSGLGLRIPIDVPLEAYVEIASDYRSRMGAVVEKIQSGKNGKIPSSDIRPKLMDLNSDIAKLSRSKRMAFLDGAIQFYQANSIYINASLTASAAGLLHGLPGCAVGAAVGGVATLARKKKWVSGGPATERAVDITKSYLSPVTDRLVAVYSGTSTLAVSVVSLRRDIERRVQSAKHPPKSTAPIPSRRKKPAKQSS